MALKALVSVLFVSSASSQNDFLRKKYSVVNNITTIDLNNCEDVEYVLSPSLVKSAQNPLFGQDKPWEVRIDNGYPNVVYTPNSGNKTWQLWYSNFIETSPRLDGTLYAQSSDGIEWTKPNLGLVSFENSLENNIVLAPTGGIGIFKDIYTANDAERFKAFGKFEICGGTAVSPDGLNWSGYRCLDLHNQFGTHNNVCACIGIYKRIHYKQTNRFFMIHKLINILLRHEAICQPEQLQFQNQSQMILMVTSQKLILYHLGGVIIRHMLKLRLNITTYSWDC